MTKACLTCNHVKFIQSPDWKPAYDGDKFGCRDVVEIIREKQLHEKARCTFNPMWADVDDRASLRTLGGQQPRPGRGCHLGIVGSAPEQAVVRRGRNPEGAAEKLAARFGIAAGQAATGEEARMTDLTDRMRTCAAAIVAGIETSISNGEPSLLKRRRRPAARGEQRPGGDPRAARRADGDPTPEPSRRRAMTPAVPSSRPRQWYDLGRLPALGQRRWRGQPRAPEPGLPAVRQPRQQACLPRGPCDAGLPGVRCGWEYRP